MCLIYHLYNTIHMFIKGDLAQHEERLPFNHFYNTSMPLFMFKLLKGLFSRSVGSEW